MDSKEKFINIAFSISKESYDAGWTMPYAHFHNDYEIYLLEYGSRIVTIEDTEYLTQTGDVALFLPRLPHKSKGNVAFNGICIHFSELYLNRYFTKTTKKILLQCFENRVIHLEEAALATIEAYAEDFSEQREDNFVILANILKLLNAAGGCECIAPKENGDAPHTKAAALIAYVNEHYYSIKNIHELAEHFQVSEGYVFKVFQKHFQITPKQYINKLRLETVCRKLQYAGNSVKKAAADSGFTSYEYFMRLFKKEYGCTPTEYRKKCLDTNKVSSAQSR